MMPATTLNLAEPESNRKESSALWNSPGDALTLPDLRGTPDGWQRRSVRAFCGDTIRFAVSMPSAKVGDSRREIPGLTT